MTKREKNVRRAACSVLRAWSKGHDYADSLIQKHALRNELGKSDRALLQTIIMGVLRHKNLLDYWIRQIRSGKLDHETLDILRIGMVQIMILHIPDHAAVHETVNCGRGSVRGLINAVLRKALLLRKRFLEDLENVSSPIRYSHPEWLWKRWRKVYGLENTIALAEWNNAPAPNYVRLCGDSDSSLPLEKLGLEETEDPRFFKVTKSLPLQEIKNGTFYVQDLATRHAVDLLAPTPQSTVLDACAAPGGKAVMIAERMQGTGALYCTDSNEKRLPRLLENLSKHNVNNVFPTVHDWTQPASDRWSHKFDFILADVPCSNTGVFRRRVDTKWRLRPDQIAELTELQRVIVQNLIPCLKPGGKLVYSTCSIDPEENQKQIEFFLHTYPQLICEKQTFHTPFVNETDGAFAGLLSLRK